MLWIFILRSLYWKGTSVLHNPFVGWIRKNVLEPSISSNIISSVVLYPFNQYQPLEWLIFKSPYLQRTGTIYLYLPLVSAIWPHHFYWTSNPDLRVRMERRIPILNPYLFSCFNLYHSTSVVEWNKMKHEKKTSLNKHCYSSCRIIVLLLIMVYVNIYNINPLMWIVILFTATKILSFSGIKNQSSLVLSLGKRVCRV